MEMDLISELALIEHHLEISFERNICDFQQMRGEEILEFARLKEMKCIERRNIHRILDQKSAINVWVSEIYLYPTRPPDHQASGSPAFQNSFIFYFILKMISEQFHCGLYSCFSLVDPQLV